MTAVAFAAGVLVACASDPPRSVQGGGAGAAGTLSTAGSPGTAGVAGSGAGMAVAGSGQGTGGMSACVPPAQPGELYALEADSLEQSDPVSMCTFRGQVLLIVNVASKCGYTPQYKPLQALYEKYKPQGFSVLAFPCNQFGGQEPGTAQEIGQFCKDNYGVTFPMFEKIEVNGPNTHPVYQWLKAQPGGGGDIPWNFTKFVVSRSGKLLARYAPNVAPDDPNVVATIENALLEKK